MRTVSSSCLSPYSRPQEWILIASLEGEAEAELRLARVIRDVGDRGRLSEVRQALGGGVSAVIGVVEHVEQLDEPCRPDPRPQLELTLEAQVHAVKRLADEVVARDDGAVGPQPRAAAASRRTQIPAPGRRKPQT